MTRNLGEGILQEDQEGLEAIVDLALAAGNDANLKFPLNFVVIGPAIAQQLLRIKDVDWEKFAVSELSTSQLENFRSAMEKAHQAFGIAYIPDDHRLRSLWNQYKEFALETILKLWDVLLPSSRALPHFSYRTIPSARLGSTMNSMFEDNPSMLKKIHNLIDILITALNSEEGIAIAEKHRRVIKQKFQEIGYDRDKVQEAGAPTQIAMETLMVEALRKHRPGQERLVSEVFGH